MGGLWNGNGHEPSACKPQTSLVHHEFRLVPRFAIIPSHITFLKRLKGSGM